MNSPGISVQENVPLAPLTTIGLGGNARLFVSCGTSDQLREALEYARSRNLRVHILGGGSNVVFADEGFDGLVVKADIKRLEFTEEGDTIMVSAGAGVIWDSLVRECIDRGLGGVECLSGIPGLVGATPIQNVGAYGQEVCQTIVRVAAVDRTTLLSKEFSNSECGFGYRQSIFKSGAVERYVVTDVHFRLRRHAQPAVQYPELQKFLSASATWSALPAGKEKLEAVREAVLTLRRRKSMVLDPADPHSRSVGSFFMNPVLNGRQLRDLQSRWKESGGGAEHVPTFPAPDGAKVPAAWLVEKAGFKKGYRIGNVGVSLHHSLALVNYGGTTRELLTLADRIRKGVEDRFGVVLEREPVIVRFD